MTTITLSEVTRDFPAALRQVRRTRRPIIIASRGKPVAIMAPPDEVENYALADEAREVLAEMDRTGDKGVSLADFRKTRGLSP